MTLGPQKFLFTRDLDLVRKIAKQDAEKYSKFSKGNFLVKDLIGDSILLNGGEM